MYNLSLIYKKVTYLSKLSIKMKMYITLKSVLSFFIVMSILFLILGLYSLDSSLLSIACLFATASIILRLEMKDHLFDPFA